MPDDGSRYELIAGELRRMSPAGWKHGAIVGRLHGWLAHHIEQHDLGRIFGAETGFLIGRDPDTLRAPDIAFISKDRLPNKDPEEVFWPGAPDLAVEVISPGDTKGEVGDKVRAWLDAGSLAVWVLDPALRNVSVYCSATEIQSFSETEELDGQEIVPGFRCLVGDLFRLA
jgi:Uma2 family endonuclease